MKVNYYTKGCILNIFDKCFDALKNDLFICRLLQNWGRAMFFSFVDFVDIRAEQCFFFEGVGVKYRKKITFVVILNNCSLVRSQCLQ